MDPVAGGRCNRRAGAGRGKLVLAVAGAVEREPCKAALTRGLERRAIHHHPDRLQEYRAASARELALDRRLRQRQCARTPRVHEVRARSGGRRRAERGAQPIAQVRKIERHHDRPGEARHVLRRLGQVAVVLARRTEDRIVLVGPALRHAEAVGEGRRDSRRRPGLERALLLDEQLQIRATRQLLGRHRVFSSERIVGRKAQREHELGGLNPGRPSVESPAPGGA